MEQLVAIVAVCSKQDACSSSDSISRHQEDGKLGAGTSGSASLEK